MSIILQFARSFPKSSERNKSIMFALITGASGGIGFAIARHLAAEGYALLLHYHRNEEAAIKLKNELRRDYEQAFQIVQADLSEEDGVHDLVMRVDQEPDVIVHNSGMSDVGLLTDMTDAKVQKMVQLHVTAPMLITKALLPGMISKKKGNIVVISSIWGLQGASMEVVYSAVKGALNAFVKALAKEVSPSGITVNGIAPGIVATNMLDHLSPQEQATLCESIPMGRFGKPEEIAKLAVFLTSGQTPYLNGEIISVDGAWS